MSVYHGHNTGRSTSATKIAQPSAGVAGTPEESDGFGTSLAAVPVQKSSQNNLIIGIPGEGVTTDPGADGYPTQLADKPSGPSGLGSISFSLNTARVQGTATSPSQFGTLVG